MPIFTFANTDPRTSVRDKLINKLSPVIDVKADFLAVGDGVADDTTKIQNALDAAYGTSGSPHGGAYDTGGAGVFLNRPVYFPPGYYKITSPLTLRSVKGAHIFGSGRFTTKIENTAGGSVFVTNGCEYSVFEAMMLNTSSTGVCFDLDWDNTGSGAALQSNTFREMYFDGGAFGLRIGNTGFMGSETTALNCFFANHTTAGIATKNGNALQETVIGGNIAGCAIGIWVGSGSVPVIHGVGFQNNSTFDIQIDNSSGDAYSIKGNRTESPNFAFIRNGASAHLAGNSQISSTAGTFAFIEGSPSASAGSGTLSIDNCWSRNGIIGGGAASTLYIRGNPAIRRPIAISGAANNGSGLIRLTVSSTAAWLTGQTHWVSGIVGSGNVAAANNNNFTVTVIDGTHIDLQGTTFSGSYTSGGVVDGATFGNPAYLGSFNGVVAQNI